MRVALIFSILGLALFARAVPLPDPDPLGCAPIPVDDDNQSPCDGGRKVKRVADQCDGDDYVSLFLSFHNFYRGIAANERLGMYPVKPDECQ